MSLLFSSFEMEILFHESSERCAGVLKAFADHFGYVVTVDNETEFGFRCRENNIRKWFAIDGVFKVDCTLISFGESRCLVKVFFKGFRVFSFLFSTAFALPVLIAFIQSAKYWELLLIPAIYVFGSHFLFWTHVLVARSDIKSFFENIFSDKKK